MEDVSAQLAANLTRLPHLQLLTNWNFCSMHPFQEKKASAAFIDLRWRRGGLVRKVPATFREIPNLISSVTRGKVMMAMPLAV